MCNIYREKDDKLNLFPKYHLYCYNNKRYLLTAKKKEYNLSSYYIISTNQDISNKESIIGKLKSDFWGLEFNAFDESISDKKCNNKETRNNLATIKYVL